MKRLLKFSISPSASNGGNLGWLNENILSKKIFKYVKNLNIGEISEIIMENNRATLIKLVDKRSSEIKDLDIKKIKIDLIDKKKMKCLLYTPQVFYQN